ncbi:MAG: glycoside hydrolase family 13 protein [Clostridiales bacterium]|jgi:glycosidase|nr:glycoside hydrolase family 13 protein [Clostridiales bacterium]
MNEEAILHIPDTKYCFAASDKTVVLRLRAAKSDILDAVNVIYGNKYDFYKTQRRAALKKRYTDGKFDWYTVKLALSDVRFVYVFEITACGKPRYFSEDGLTDAFDFKLAYFNSFQLPYINAIDVHRVVPWMREAVFYQIFVDRFNRGDYEKDDGYINLKWGDLPTAESFAGGDLKGITAKLDYLTDLGVNVLYLTPIFRSISNHKYDISDYYGVDRHFGGNEDFRTLVEAAHGKGIRIVLDAVFNHCSERLPQFQDVIKKGRESHYYDWFIIHGDKPDPAKCNYECFASCGYMPKFNTSNKELQRYLIDVAAHWIKDYGIDGWRLDVSDEVSHNFWRHFTESVKEVKDDCVIIGENWHDANPFLHGEQYDSIMNYAFTKACLDFFADNKLTAQGFAERLNGLLMRNTDQVNAMMLNILDSHDTHRFLTLLKGDEDKLICALAVTFMYLGAPGIYYGTEIGIRGGYDPDCRRTFDWEKANKDTPLMGAVRALIGLKKRPELQCGEIALRAELGLFILERTADKKVLRLTVNNTGADAETVADGSVVLSRNAQGGRLKSGGFVIEAL